MTEPTDLVKRRAGQYPEHIVMQALGALAANSGNASLTARQLIEDGVIDKDPTTFAGVIRCWSRDKYAKQYRELQDKLAPDLEATLVHSLRNRAQQAIELQELALDKTMERLERNMDEDPSRTAANLARVAQANIDKSLAYQGRPSRITEVRDPYEVLRALAARVPGLIDLPDEAVVEESTPELEEGSP
jgi:hypothetical protein